VDRDGLVEAAAEDDIAGRARHGDVLVILPFVGAEGGAATGASLVSVGYISRA